MLIYPLPDAKLSVSLIQMEKDPSKDAYPPPPEILPYPAY